MPRDLWIATTNQGKLREIQALLADKDWTLHSLKELPAYTPPPETGTTFVENARIKAKSLAAMKPGQWVLAEDSGLEVTGLGNLPGVHSSTYAGNHAKDSENYLRVIKMLHLKSVADRSARLRTSLVVVNPSGEEMVVEGFLEGQIARAPAGTDGFGYDPIFIPNGETKTLAELGLAFKNRVSHRAKAVENWLKLNP